MEKKAQIATQNTGIVCFSYLTLRYCLLFALKENSSRFSCFIHLKNFSFTNLSTKIPILFANTDGNSNNILVQRLSIYLICAFDGCEGCFWGVSLLIFCPYLCFSFLFTFCWGSPPLPHHCSFLFCFDSFYNVSVQQTSIILSFIMGNIQIGRDEFKDHVTFSCIKINFAFLIIKNQIIILINNRL